VSQKIADATGPHPGLTYRRIFSERLWKLCYAYDTGLASTDGDLYNGSHRG